MRTDENELPTSKMLEVGNSFSSVHANAKPNKNMAHLSRCFNEVTYCFMLCYLFSLNYFNDGFGYFKRCADGDAASSIADPRTKWFRDQNGVSYENLLRRVNTY